MNMLAQWQNNSSEHLAKALDWLRLRLTSLAQSPPEVIGVAKNKESEGREPYNREPVIQTAYEQMRAAEDCYPEPALVQLRQRFNLSQFGQDLLLLCAAVELDPRLADLCAQAQGNPNWTYPTFALALACLIQPDWQALSPRPSLWKNLLPSSPLRYWQLIDIYQPGAQPLTTSPLRINERILHYIQGFNHLDDHLSLILKPVLSSSTTTGLSKSQQSVVDTIVQRRGQNGLLPIVQLVGLDALSQQRVAQQAACQMRSHLYYLSTALLPNRTSEIETLVRLWNRETKLASVALLVDTHETTGPIIADGQASLLPQLLASLEGTCFVSCRTPLRNLGQSTLTLDVEKPTLIEQATLWTAIPNIKQSTPRQLASQFNLNGSTIEQIVRETVAMPPTQLQEKDTLHQHLWQACRKATRPQLDMLAQRIDAKAQLDDIVLPPEVLDLLKQIKEQVLHRSQVYQTWGWDQKMNRGFGISALFSGDSGTGKTMAAEVIATALNLDLYRIDLSAVVSKYIGETEKNLRRLFDAAEDSGAILFFDEADALFGKRSEVKDSHDRYANIEVNYLLQRMEAYRGLAILATNLKSSLDSAFVRRLRFIVEFPFPDAGLRETIWKKAFPDTNQAKTPIDNLDYKRLARLNLTGGSIHNIALNASFMAAAAAGIVTMPLLFRAARDEFRKQGRSINERDFVWESPQEVMS